MNRVVVFAPFDEIDVIKCALDKHLTALELEDILTYLRGTIVIHRNDDGVGVHI